MFNSSFAREMTDYLELRTAVLSASSASNDRRVLLLLDQYLVLSGFQGKELTEDILSAWSKTLSGKSKTVKEKLAVVRGFGKYLNTLGHQSFLPTLGWRDLVLLCVMYSSGARAQEICDLTVKDVTHDERGNAILTLVGKGEKARRVKITSSATQLLDKYIASRKISIELNRHVFPSQRNDHLSVAAVEEIYEKYTKRAKAEHPELFCHGPYTPHVMRHTTATHLIESGVPLAIVKNILGHTSIQTTQIYLDISQQTVDRSMEKWNEKWFSKNNPDETALPQEEESIPAFLK